MSIIGWLLLGMATGFIVSRVYNKTGEGWILDVTLGGSGALMAGVAFTHLVSRDVVAQFELSSMLVALAGAAIVLLPYRLSFRRTLS
jgi:uncharacterized membrane protein YeaQ/YmgE (transglycosylase-associated protein family)